MASDLVAIENRLWAAADQLWANTGLKPAEFSTPVLGLIFLRYADKRFGECDRAVDAKGIPPDEREAMDYQAEGVLYLPLQARFSHLLTLTEGANLGRAIATAMELVEAHNPELHGVLPRGYNLLPQGTPSTGNANYLWIQRCAAGLAELFIDARPYFKQITRAIREFTPEKLEFPANIADVAGLRKAATLARIEAQGRSLNPGRRVGVGARAADCAGRVRTTAGAAAGSSRIPLRFIQATLATPVTQTSRTLAAEGTAGGSPYGAQRNTGNS